MTQLFSLWMLALGIFAWPGMAQAAGLFAHVSSVSGGALLSNGNGSGTFALNRGYALNPGDRVDTRQGGRVVIDLSDGSLMVVHPGAVLTFKDFRAAASLRELFEIAIGMVRVKIHHLTGKPNPYRMNSPTASVAVRGTEFDIAVDETGDTTVDVFEGAVEVGRLDDPSDRALIEAGHGVVVRPGHPLQLTSLRIAPTTPPAPRLSRDRAAGEKPFGPPLVRAGAHRRPAAPQSVHASVRQDKRETTMVRAPALREQPKSERTAGEVLEAEVALSTVAEAPLLYRYNAYSDLHLDSYENPAYATAASASEARASIYGTSPQLSVVHSLGQGFFAGGTLAAGASRTALVPSASASPLTAVSEAADLKFTSFSAFVARRFGESGVGFSVETIRAGSTIRSETDRLSVLSGPFARQTRLTAGATTRAGRRAELGFYARYSFLQAGLSERLLSVREPMGRQTADAMGRAVNVGFRLRGLLTSKLTYGVAGDIGTLAGGIVGPRVASVAGGLGYRLSPGTLLSADVTAGRIANSGASSPFTSMHFSVHRDVTRHLFGVVSFLKTWRNEALPLPLWRDQYAQFGGGWRLGAGWVAQYTLTNDSVIGRPQHMVGLLYTFRFRE